MKRNALIASVVLLAGCAGPLTADNSVTTTAVSKHSSEQTFRNMLRVMKECYPDGLVIRPTFFPEAKEGEIDIYYANDFGNIPFASWYVSPSSTGATVKQVRRNRSPSKLDLTLPEWIEGDATNCPGGSRFEPRPPGSELNQNNMPVR